MATTLNERTKLNHVQINLLWLFKKPMSNKETLKIQNLLAHHYSELLKEEMTKAIEEKVIPRTPSIIY